ncbi:MAG: hypothetical protein P8M22_04950 [Phycisphaerales bacterium]|nr:hypothetical protein [Phycisphaerales bacterium]
MAHHMFPISRPTLWITAILLAILIIIQAGGQSNQVVHADMVTEGGGFTMLTLAGRNGSRHSGSQSLIILDNAAGWLMAYELTGNQPNRVIELLDGGPLDRFFNHGQGSSSQIPRP